MSSLKPDQRMCCTFRRISREDTKKLIQFPDKRTYICGTCALEPDRLTPVSLGAVEFLARR